MHKRVFYLSLMLILAFLIVPELVHAQCPMCKLMAEKGKEAGSLDADGLNIGILYLLAFPYLIIGFIAYRVFIKNKQSQTV